MHMHMHSHAHVYSHEHASAHMHLNLFLWTYRSSHCKSSAFLSLEPYGFYSLNLRHLLLQHVHRSWAGLRALEIPIERGKVDSEADRLSQGDQTEPHSAHWISICAHLLCSLRVEWWRRCILSVSSDPDTGLVIPATLFVYQSPNICTGGQWDMGPCVWVQPKAQSKKQTNSVEPDCPTQSPGLCCHELLTAVSRRLPWIVACLCVPLQGVDFVLCTVALFAGAYIFLLQAPIIIPQLKSVGKAVAFSKAFPSQLCFFPK